MTPMNENGSLSPLAKMTKSQLLCAFADAPGAMAIIGADARRRHGAEYRHDRI